MFVGPTKPIARQTLTTADRRLPRAVGDITPGREIEFVRALRVLIDKGRGIDTHLYEEGPPAAVHDTLLPRMTRFYRATDWLSSIIFRHYEPRARDEDYRPDSSTLEMSFDSKLDDLMANSSAAGRIADIAFRARIGVMRKHQELMRVPGDADTWEYLAACSSLRRRVLKVATSLEHAICEYEGFSAESDWHDISVRRSLAIRDAYVSFRRSLDLHEPLADGDMRVRIRLAGIALAKLTGKDIYEELRIEDRRRIREMQGRVLSWLRQACDGEPDVDEGRQLWQAIGDLCDELMHVNDRVELRQHDMEIVATACADLEEGIPCWEHRAELLSLMGRDEELDRCIDDGEDCPSEVWGRVLGHVRQRLGDCASPTTH